MCSPSARSSRRSRASGSFSTRPRSDSTPRAHPARSGHTRCTAFARMRRPCWKPSRRRSRSCGDSAILATEAVATDGAVTSVDGTRLLYRGWTRAQATHTFAVVHGLGDHSGRYEAFAEAMRKRGMATYAVDLRGHGKSQGQRGHVDSWNQWTDDVASFVARVESLTAGEVIPLGHSFGGVAMLSTVLAGKLKRARRFIVSWPAPPTGSSIRPGASGCTPRLRSRAHCTCCRADITNPSTTSVARRCSTSSRGGSTRDA